MTCTRCGKPLAGRAWRSTTGRVVCDDCTQGATYLTQQLHAAAKGAGTTDRKDGFMTRVWARLLGL